MAKRNEDVVRDEAKKILGFDEVEDGIIQGTGQITTFNELGFPDAGRNKKPDGWYLPSNPTAPAIVLEAKAESKDIYADEVTAQLQEYIDIASVKYSKVIGIIYNGRDVRVFKNKQEIDTVTDLQHKSYYIKLYTNQKMDKERIYAVTQRINDLLHFKFGMTKLQDRMIFTACALVAQRYDNSFIDMCGKRYNVIKTWITQTIQDNMGEDPLMADKIKVLLEELRGVKVSITDNQEAIDGFVKAVCEISDLVTSDLWNGEDVMSIFFNEFNRYKSKSDAGQVFTPDHITNFMYHLIGCNKTDKILDATCGSGAFLVRAMCNMINEAGGPTCDLAEEIRTSHLFGIELYREVFALACANMVIHKDGRSNLVQLDSTSEAAGKWIKAQGITKVLMNPPYERKYGCMKIVANVLDNVPKGTKCAFILPEKKLEKDNGKKLLTKHTLTTIVKLPEDLFFGVGVTTSIYVFETGRPQIIKTKDGEKSTSKIIAYNMEDDGLVAVKNMGRHDVKNRWDAIEAYWLNAIQIGEEKTKQIIDPIERLSYQVGQGEFVLYLEDLMSNMVDFMAFNVNMTPKEIIINSLTKEE